MASSSFDETIVPPICLGTLSKSRLQELCSERSASTSGTKADMVLRLRGVTWTVMGIEAAREMAAKAHISQEGSLQELALAITQQSLGEGLEVQTTDGHATTQALALVQRFCFAFNASPNEIDSGLCALDPRCYMLRYHTSGHIYSPGAHNVKLALLELQSQFRISGELRPPYAKIHAETDSHAIIFLWCRLDYREITTPPDAAMLYLEVVRFDQFSSFSSANTPTQNDQETWLIAAIKLAPAASPPQLTAAPSSSNTLSTS